MVFKGKRRRRFWSPKSSSSLLLLRPNLDVVPILIIVVPKGIVRRIRQTAVYPEATLYWNQKSKLTTTAASGIQFQCRIVAEAKAFCCGGRGTRTGWEGRREKGKCIFSFLQKHGWVEEGRSFQGRERGKGNFASHPSFNKVGQRRL